eukprot:EG_transcript_26749
MPIPAFLEVRQIPEDDPRTELRGQFGVFATDAIPAYSVIGHYKSWAGSEDEYYRQPVSPLHWIHFDSYCYMSEGTVLVNGRQQPLYYSAYAVGNHTQFINDCRFDPFSVSVSPQRSPLNCAFAEVLRHGRLYVIVLSVRPVAPGEELLLDYSDAYWDAIRADRKRWETCRDALSCTPLISTPCLHCLAQSFPSDQTNRSSPEIAGTAGAC